MENMKVIAVTQARVGSSRLPRKVLKKIKNETLLQIHLERILKSKVVDQVIVATTHESEVDEICKIADDCGVVTFKGSNEDVLDRFYQATKSLEADYIVRLTSDNPLIDASLIDEVIEYCINKGVDYCSNTLIEMFPDGQDIEVLKFSALEKAWKEAKLKSEREHVTPYVKKNSNFSGGNKFTALNFEAETDMNAIRMTVDESEDFDAMKDIIENMGVDKTWREYSAYIHKKRFELPNQSLIRNEGYIISLKNDDES